MILQKSAFKYLDFLGKCTNVVFSVEPRICDGWSGNCNKCFRSILPYFLTCNRHRMLFSLEMNFNTLHDLLRVSVCLSVCLSVCPLVSNLGRAVSRGFWIHGAFINYNALIYRRHELYLDLLRFVVVVCLDIRVICSFLYLQFSKTLGRSPGFADIDLMRLIFNCYSL